MSSVPPDDLTARARIVGAALDHFAAQGFRGSTVRQIAESAGVSPALVMHHFGGKEGLRRECDDRVIQFVTEKRDALDSSKLLKQATDRYGPYLARMLSEPGAAGDALFDLLLDTSRALVDDGIRAGTMRASADRDAQAAALLTLGVAPFFLAHQLARWSAGDAATGISRVSQPVADIYARGLLTGAATPAVKS